MKAAKNNRLMALLILAAFAIAYPQAAPAAGTASGTSISNTATVDYSVGGIGQTPITSVAATFVVDNKVDVTVVDAVTTYVSVTPGAASQVLTFTVTNTGNTTQDFALAASDSADPYGGADNFDATPVGVFVESGATAGYQVAEDTATYIDELAADGSRTVYIVSDIPGGQANSDISAKALTATARIGGTGGALGGALTETAGADTAGVDIVFADVAGDVDGNRDAAHSDRGAYRVTAAVLTITKTATTIRDPFNLNVNPKAIPGAYLRYVITVANTAGASAVLTTITDALNANTTIDPDLIVAATGAPESAAGSGFKVMVSGSTRAQDGANQYFTTTSSVDGVEYAAPNVTATMTTVLPVEAGYLAGELKAGETVTITFNVTINN